MGVREGKNNGGGGRKFARLFRRNFPKKNFTEKLSKIVVDGGRSDYETFLLDSIFPTKLREFPTKLTEFVHFARL